MGGLVCAALIQGRRVKGFLTAQLGMVMPRADRDPPVATSAACRCSPAQDDIRYDRRCAFALRSLSFIPRSWENRGSTSAAVSSLTAPIASQPS